MRKQTNIKNDNKTNILEMLFKCSHKKNENSTNSSHSNQPINPDTSNHSQKKKEGKLVQLDLSSFTKSKRQSESLEEFYDEHLNEEHKIVESSDKFTYEYLAPFRIEFKNIEQEYEKDKEPHDCYNLGNKDFEKHDKQNGKIEEVKSDKEITKFTPGNNLLAFITKAPKHNPDVTECRQEKQSEPILELNWKEINNYIKKSNYFPVPSFLEVQQEEEDEESLSVEVLSGGPEDEEERREDFMNKIKKESEPSKMSVDFIIKPIKPMKMQIGGRNKKENYQEINAIAVTFHSEQTTYQMDFENMRKTHPEIIKSLFESFM